MKKCPTVIQRGAVVSEWSRVGLNSVSALIYRAFDGPAAVLGLISSHPFASHVEGTKFASEQGKVTSLLRRTQAAPYTRQLCCGVEQSGSSSGS